MGTKSGGMRETEGRGGSVLPGASPHIAFLGGVPGPEGRQTWVGSAASHTTSCCSEGPRSLGRKGCRGLRDMQGQPTVGGGRCLPLQRLPTPLWVPGPDLCGQHQLQACLLLASQQTQPVRGATRPGERAPCPLPARSGPGCAARTALVTRPLAAPHSTGLKTPQLPLKTQRGNGLGSGLPVASSMASVVASPVAPHCGLPHGPLLWPPPWPPFWPPLWPPLCPPPWSPL